MTGLEIKVARIKLGIKSYVLAQMLGINPDVMSRIENGRLQPTEHLMKKIEILLNEEGKNAGNVPE